MFTGLIQAIGKVSFDGERLVIKGCQPLEPLLLGDSISVDGVCLTVSELINNGFIADVSEETLIKTTLGEKAKSRGFVNLEPALRLSDRLGGHLVSGHVDGTGEIINIRQKNKSWDLEIGWNDLKFSKYICDKASISVNGISLTIAGHKEKGTKFWIAVIPHTWEQTALNKLIPGDIVNLEVDIMAKYAENLLIDTASANKSSNHQPTISNDWLKEQGWQ